MNNLTWVLMHKQKREEIKQFYFSPLRICYLFFFFQVKYCAGQVLLYGQGISFLLHQMDIKHPGLQ